MRIVTFNIHWMQGSAFDGDQPGLPRPAVLTKAGQVLSSLAPELLCVQEVQSAKAAGALAAACGLAYWLYSPGRMLRPQFGGAIATGEEKWTLLDASEPPIERFAVKATRREPGFQFCVANVHLRSDKYDSPERAARGRYEELAAVLEAEPLPQVVAGDFNAQPGADLWSVMDDHGYVDAAGLTGQGDAVTTVGGRRHDRVWVKRDQAGRVLRVQIVAAGQTRLNRKDHLSDHLPVVVELDI